MRMKRGATSNLTIIFTDMEGFTSRTSGLSRDQIDALLVIHERITAKAVKDYGGQIVKSLGDGYMIVFQSPTNAIHCAMKIQKDIADHNANIPKAEHLWVRIAANSGEVAMKEKDIFGEPVNVASRLLAQTEAGDIAFTEAVYLAMNKTEIPTTSASTKILRGVPEAVKVYRVPRIGEKAKPRSVLFPEDAYKKLPFYSRMNVAFAALACLAAILLLVTMKTNNWKPLTQLKSDILGTETEEGADPSQDTFFEKLLGGLWTDRDDDTNTTVGASYDGAFMSGSLDAYNGSTRAPASPTVTPTNRPRRNNSGESTSEYTGSNPLPTPVPPTTAPALPTPVSCPPGHVLVNGQCLNRPQASVTPVVTTPAPTSAPTNTPNQGGGNSGNNNNNNSGNGSTDQPGSGNGSRGRDRNNDQNNNQGNSGNNDSGGGSSVSDPGSNGKSKNK